MSAKAQTNETRATIEERESRLYETCLAKLQAYFDDELDGGDEVKTAIQAANMLAKREQTRGAKEAVRFAMAQAISKTPEDLARYVAATQPVISRQIIGEER